MMNKTIGEIDAWAHNQGLTGIGRISLLKMIYDLQEQAKEMRLNLTSLLTEVRIYRRSGICLSGWHCAFCKTFNGGIKRDTCRQCNRNKKDAWGTSLAGNQARYEGTFMYSPKEKIHIHRWRIGTKLGRTIYLDNKFVGVVDTVELAQNIVHAMNTSESKEYSKE